MRATLLKAWPDLSLYFGLHPWDALRLSIPEWAQYMERLDQIRRQQK